MDLEFKSAHVSHYIPLSRWRERVRVRVDTCYIPLTFVLSPRGEEMERG
jgi:hypothetical protein